MAIGTFREWLREAELNEASTSLEKYTNLAKIKYVIYDKMSKGIQKMDSYIKGKFYFGDNISSTDFFIGSYIDTELELKDSKFPCVLTFGITSRDMFDKEVNLVETYISNFKDSNLVKDLNVIFEKVTKTKINPINRYRKGDYRSKTKINLTEKDYNKLIDEIMKKIGSKIN